jgi:hypothetical protein
LSAHKAATRWFVLTVETVTAGIAVSLSKATLTSKKVVVEPKYIQTLPLRQSIKETIEILRLKPIKI